LLIITKKGKGAPAQARQMMSGLYNIVFEKNFDLVEA
jgi:hypothetical protein